MFMVCRSFLDQSIDICCSILFYQTIACVYVGMVDDTTLYIYINVFKTAGRVWTLGDRPGRPGRLVVVQDD